MSWRARVLSLAFPSRQPRHGVAAQAGLENPADVFTRVYRDSQWGKGWGKKFFSGPGSHDPAIVAPYIQSVAEFLSQFPRPPDVVDLGCGDFHLGKQLRHRCGRYTAGDVVPDLIKHNARAFARLDVEFVCLNIADDPLPAGGVVFIRQVLQHLSNAQISQVLPKLRQYRHLVITEHLPADPAFIPNLDHSFGSGIRMAHNSGVVLTQPPFNLSVTRERELCSVAYGSGIIRTLAYSLG